MRICGNDITVKGRLIRIARPDGDTYESLDDPQSMVKGLQTGASRVDLLSFMQIMPQTEPRQAFHMEWDNLAVLPVSTFEHWWSRQIRTSSRNRVRRAEKLKVTTRELSFGDSLARGIWEVYNESPIRQGKPNHNYGKDFERVKREASTFVNHSIFIGAFLDEQLIGFVKMVVSQGNTQASIMNIVSMIRHRDKAPTNALIAHAVRTCAQRGIPYLVYGHFTYGKKTGDGLSGFKQCSGFERVDLPRYYIPLTALGRAALRLSLHHSFVERLPEPIPAKLRELRRAWYNRKLQSATQPL
jgi:hypothetical protein